MHDVDGLGGGSTGHLVLCAGAVVRKAEEGALVGIFQPDACVGGGLPDLSAGGELGVLIRHVAAAAVAVRHMGVSSGIKIALAADVQAGVVIHVDELGAGGAFAVVVVQRLPRHEQLQKLVAAGAQRPHLRDGVGVVVHRAEAGDAALHLALNEQVSRADAALRAGVLPLGVADVVHHHADNTAVAAARLAGKGVGVIGGQAAVGALCRGFGCRSCVRGCGFGAFRGCRAALPEGLLQPAGKAVAHTGAAGGRAAGQSQRGGCQPRDTENGTTRDLFHAKNLLIKKALRSPGAVGTVARGG